VRSRIAEIDQDPVAHIFGDINRATPPPNDGVISMAC
jgi:hypothetical protein